MSVAEEERYRKHVRERWSVISQVSYKCGEEERKNNEGGEKNDEHGIMTGREERERQFLVLCLVLDLYLGGL